MKLSESQIYSIKNLDLIYIFATDSILNNETNKYIGAKVVYDNKKTLTFDYTDKYFEKYIKKILEVYNNEKENRNIVLLGDLTKELINNSSFEVLSSKKEITQEKGLAYFNTEDKDKTFQLEYLKQTIEMILDFYKGEEGLIINNIDGYNHKYIVDFNIYQINIKIPILITKNDKFLKFKLNIKEKGNLLIEGTIDNSNGKIISTWQDKNKNLNGCILYDTKNNLVEKVITSNDEIITYTDKRKSLEKEDMDIIEFYSKLYNLEIPNNIIKTSDNTYLLGEEKNISNSSNEVIKEAKMIEIKLNEDEVNIKNTINNGFSKYNNQINGNLNEYRTDITIEKIKVDEKDYILVEEYRKDKTISGYNYKILEVASNTNLTKPFDIIKSFNIEDNVKTIEEVKKYIKTKGDIK